MVSAEYFVMFMSIMGMVIFPMLLVGVIFLLAIKLRSIEKRYNDALDNKSETEDKV